MKKRTRRATRSPTGDPLLLTPGPLTTSGEVKQAMLHDLGSRDAEFIELTRRVRGALLGVVNGASTHECVPIGGSGTYAVEAMLATLVPRRGKLLNLVNGAYGRRITRICEYIGREVVACVSGEDQPVDPARIDRILNEDAAITHVCVVHCETSSGILNPLHAVAGVAARHSKALLVDAMSSFGALPLDLAAIRVDGIAASSGKCLEGVPGMGFCVMRREALTAASGNAHSLSLDLQDQWRALEDNGQWRFTPPTHCLMALDQALKELAEEGGPAGRYRRYAENRDTLVGGMQEMGFRPFLAGAHQAPIIVSFLYPADPAFSFDAFYNGLRERGFVIYPGKLTARETFRIGCIGRLYPEHMRAAVKAVRDVIGTMGVRNGSPD